MAEQALTVWLGGDHGGYQLKEQIKTWLAAWGYDYQDLGPVKLDPEDDYPQFAAAVAEKIAAASVGFQADDDALQTKQLGILVCRSGGGVTIVANKLPGVRAVAAASPKEASHAREHNNANVISLSGDWMDETTTQETVKTFLTTPFSPEPRHHRRVMMISDLETTHQPLPKKS